MHRRTPLAPSRRVRAHLALPLATLLGACGAGDGAPTPPPEGAAATAPVPAAATSGPDAGARPAAASPDDSPLAPSPADPARADATRRPGAAPDAASASGPIRLPVEVFATDAGPAVEVRAFELADAEGVDRLALTCHRCGYRDGSTNPARGAKASVRLNGGAWVDLDDATAEVARPERLYGGVDGGYPTVRLSVPIAGAVDGTNELEFRFNGTDGRTNGYRVIDLDLLADGRGRLRPRDLGRDDPTRWSAPSDAPADVRAGRALWRARGTLAESPLAAPGTRLGAACADCHASDARDLAYFNYSNASIEARARFHGLSAAEARQVASYVRTRDVPAPPEAAPWNPPYQPGPGLDARPLERWAAGAGLDAVLDDDAEMLPHLFPDGTSRAAVDAVVSTRATLNLREMPIALQLPDWNAWLPEDHPLDVFGDAWLEARPVAELARVTAALEGGGAEAMRTDPASVAAGRLLADGPDAVQRAVRRFTGVNGAQPCRNPGVHRSEAMALLGRDLGGAAPAQGSWAGGDPDFCERPMRAVHHWASVRQWELGQRFALEDAPRDVYAWGEARGWAAGERQVFDLAPHRIGNDSVGFAHLGRVESA